MRVIVAVLVVACLAIGGGAAWLSHDRAAAASRQQPTPGTPTTTTAPPPGTASPTTAPPTPTPTPTPTAVGIDLAAHSTTDPASIWVVVNKQHPISPLDYEPDDLVSVAGGQVRSIVAPDLKAMLAAAKADGVVMGLRTGFRSYNFQLSVHADNARRNGAAHADQYSARAGYSEHQTGLAFDLHSTSKPSCDLKDCFTQTVEGRWAATHAWEFGFVVRYTPANTALTGYSPEAWHLRYVGRDLAAWMHTTGVTSLEQAFGITGGPDYPPA